MAQSEPLGNEDRFRGCLIGLAAGDAVGTTVEFRPRGSFAPLVDMVGGGPFGLRPGEWTDDTSMALCLAASLIECGRFDAADQARRYVRWWHEGYMSSNGRCFDIGVTVSDSLRRFERTGNPLAGSSDPDAAGNGCIMRLAPVVMFFYPDEQEAVRNAVESARVTHQAPECLDACRLFAQILYRALAGAAKQDLLLGSAGRFTGAASIAAIASGHYLEKTEHQIRGSGYVVASLEAALWCFHTTSSFRECILRAANLGDDADTTAAVAGQVAGAYYGLAAIPEEWRNKLARRDEIVAMADGLMH
jgi:ADP-ribosyl-[dinitrogen reductase] hydrolase